MAVPAPVAVPPPAPAAPCVVRMPTAIPKLPTPIYSPSGDAVVAWPGELDVLRGRRSPRRAPYQRIYAPNYGLTHGWGVPGGRWDPSQARD